MYGQEYQIVVEDKDIQASQQNADGTNRPSPRIGNLQPGKMLFVGPGGRMTHDLEYVQNNCRWIVAAGRATAIDRFIFEPHLPMDQQGGGGGGVAGYTHTQSTPSDLWTINHGLGRYVSVTVYDEDGEEVVRDLTFVDLDTCTVRLVAPTTGHAACV
jgi:hypothetical protein